MDNSSQVIEEFLQSGFDLKKHLCNYLDLSLEQIQKNLEVGLKNMAEMHPGSLKPEDVSSFYEKEVGTAHLLDLASWHLGSSNYIADTIRMQILHAHGKVLDFGGGIGTHAIAAAKLSKVDNVFFVDINPQNREFVSNRIKSLGLQEKISVHRDLSSTGDVKFDTLVCLDVLEHLPDPSAQLLEFLERLSKKSIALMNWYFYKGDNNQYPFHFDDEILVQNFFLTLQENFLEVFHPLLITARAYRPIR